MLDAHIRPLIDPPLDAAGRYLAASGMTANLVTLVGLGIGLLAALAIAFGFWLAAILLILMSRIADGLDGAIARATGKTDFGGYLDITCDFLFYGVVPMAFVWVDPVGNGAAGAWLLASFYINGATFLGYAILAEKHGLATSKHGAKSLYFTGGLLEGTETIMFFVAICVWPDWFAPMAWVFGGVCFVTAASRILLARQVFEHTNDKDNG
ncbi:CDP-alcohol phosphatidyltransferase family protein [Tateyamaria omphalii]|uniref:CDP-alcohol phosphatidyltransferase family protein n=1 Tax=Tateyamaria omphalii TaxID=299262 RepID=UPI001C9A1287|nr:CDP-alcohol phosphatidyltransferase family protein [Tateyamaria omphalii]MBY5932734.1 CDP-alcohol phosphatidyltransferase family protein [Tateyamaria omphalii]